MTLRAREETLRILEAALSIASASVDDAEVTLGGGNRGETCFSGNAICSSREHDVDTLGLRVALREAVVRVETTDLSTRGIREAVQHAKTAVEHMPRDANFSGFAGPQVYAEVDAYDPACETLQAVDRTGMAARAITTALRHGAQASGRIAVRRGSIEDGNCAGIYAVANTRGLVAYHAATRVDFEVTIRGKSDATGVAGASACFVSDVDVDDVVRRALEGALQSGAAKTPPSTCSTVIFEPSALAMLLQFVAATSGSEAMASGASFLSGAIGKRIAHESVTISDDFAHDLARGIPFDVEGVAKSAVTIVRKGVAESPVYGRKSANREKTRATGHTIYDPALGETDAASHLVFEGGDATLSDLIGSTKRGMLVACLSDALLIDSRRLEIEGVTHGARWIEGGTIVASVGALRFRIRLMDVLNRIDGATRGVSTGSVVAPAIKVDGLELAIEART